MLVIVVAYDSYSNAVDLVADPVTESLTNFDPTTLIVRSTVSPVEWSADNGMTWNPSGTLLDVSPDTVCTAASSWQFNFRQAGGIWPSGTSGTWQPESFDLVCP